MIPNVHDRWLTNDGRIFTESTEGAVYFNGVLKHHDFEEFWQDCISKDISIKRYHQITSKGATS